MDAHLIKNVIDKKEDFLRRHLVLSTTVIQTLRQTDVIGEFTMKQMLANRENSNRQMTLLLNSIKSRGLPAFHGFLETLRVTYHNWIADDIMETNVDTVKSDPATQNSTNVRSMINRLCQQDLYSGQLPGPPFHSAPVYPVIPCYPPQSGPVMYRIPEVGDPSLSYAHGYSRKRSHFDPRRDEYVLAKPHDGRISPITQVPENLRDLQKVFDTESSVTHSSITMLRQEEMTIKSLLQQNLREQQDLLFKQEALADIKDKMKEINTTATQLYKPQPDSSLARTRLKYLQRVPLSQKY